MGVIKGDIRSLDYSPYDRNLHQAVSKPGSQISCALPCEEQRDHGHNKAPLYPGLSLAKPVQCLQLGMASKQ